MRHPNENLRDVIIQTNTLDKDKVDQYIKTMSLCGSEKENTEKLAAMWMYATHMGTLPPPSVRKLPPLLIPASPGSSALLTASKPPAPPHAMLLSPPPPAAITPVMPYRRAMATYPYIHPGSVLYTHHGTVPGTYRTHRSTKSTGISNQHRRRRSGNAMRSGKNDVNRRQRRKSEADVLDGQQAQAFQYTGLDRAIADSFLARQEQSQTGGSHLEYSSSSSASETYRKPSSRSSSKTKIVCRDVVM